MHVIGGLILFVIIVGVCGVALARAVERAGGVRGGGVRSSSPGSRGAKGGGANSLIEAAAHPSPRHIRAAGKAKIAEIWEGTKATDWIEQRRHDRQHGTSTTWGGPGTAPGGVTTATGSPANGRRTVLGIPLGPFRPATAPGGNGVNGGNGNGPGTPPAPPPGANGTPGTNVPQAPPSSPGAPPNGTAPTSPAPTTAPGGTPVPNGSNGSVEQVVDGLNKIQAGAASGGIHAKQEALKAMNEAALRMAATATMIARAMSEPGSHYGPEITEPIAKSAQHFQAGSMVLAEGDTNLATLINTTVGELAKSPRQAPHHNELSESGTH